MDIVDIKSAPIKVMTDASRKSLGDDDTNNMFDIAYQWQDKPHRHVWDLCKRLDEAADEIERLRQINAELVDALKEAIDPHSGSGSQVWLDKVYDILDKATGGE